MGRDGEGGEVRERQGVKWLRVSTTGEEHLYWLGKFFGALMPIGGDEYRLVFDGREVMKLSGTEEEVKKLVGAFVILRGDKQ